MVKQDVQAIILFLGIAFAHAVRRVIYPILYDWFPSKKRILDEYQFDIAMVIYGIATVIYMCVMGRFLK